MAGMILTNAGQELITQALLGKTLTFTKVKIGEGILSGQNEKELTELISPYKEIDISKVEKAGKGLTKVRVVFSNEGFQRVVNFREVGVYAKIDDEVEVLYSYENYGDAVESIPADDGINIVEKIIDTMNYVDDADNVTAIIDKSAVYATMVDLEEAQSAICIEIKNLDNKKSNKSDIIETPNGETVTLPEDTNLDGIGATGFYNVLSTINGIREYWYIETYAFQINGYTLQRATGVNGVGNVFYERTCVAGKWQHWKTYTDTSNLVETLLGNAIVITSIDLNTELNTGFYFADGCPSRPVGRNGYLSVEKYSIQYIKQTYSDHLNGDTWIRVSNNGIWGSWNKVATSNWQPLPLASGFSTETGENQAMYCDLGGAYIFKGIIWGTITPNIKLFNLNHGYLAGIAGDSIVTPSTWITSGTIGQTTAGTGRWIVLSGIAGK